MSTAKPTTVSRHLSSFRRFLAALALCVLGIVIAGLGFAGLGNGWSDQIFPSNTTMFTGLAFSGSAVWEFGSRSTVPAPGSSSAKVYAASAYWDGSAWHTQNPSIPGVMSQFDNGTSGPGSTMWAVGATQNSTQYSDSLPWKPLIMEWDGSKWMDKTPASVPLGGQFYSVSAPSRSDVWTVGFVNSKAHPQYQSIAYHYDGTSWHALPSPSAGTGLYAVSALSGSNVWAAGWVGAKGSPALFDWTGSAWKRFPILGVPSSSSTNVNIMSLSFDSPNDGWAVGTYPNSKLSGHVQVSQASIPLVAHWNGSTWHTVSTGGFPSSLLISVQSVQAFSASNVWVCGGYTNTVGNPNAFKPFLAHWNGSTWNVQSQINFSTFNGGMANAVAGSSNGTVAVSGLDSAGSSLLIGSSSPLAARSITTSFAGLPNGVLDLLAEVLGVLLVAGGVVALLRNGKRTPQQGVEK